MKRYVLIIILFMMFIPFTVNAKETLTITYDANDGSGRTKVVELEKGDVYTVLGTDVFEKINDDKDNPMDDEIVTRWTLNQDNSDFGYCAFCSWSRTTSNGGTNSTWEFLNSQTELTLYAQWDKRVDISDLIISNSLTGEGVVQDENGNYSILDKKDFQISFSFKENSSKQINNFSYYRLPKYFTDALPFYIKEKLEDPTPLPIKCQDGYTTYTYTGVYYIKDDILYIDLIDKGDAASKCLYSAGNLKFNIMYDLKWVQKTVNNRVLYSATVTFNLDSRDSIEIYQKGKIITEFIDIDSNVELLDNETNIGILGDLHTFEPVEIEGYELISYPENVEFEEEEQHMKYYYKKVNKTKDNKNIVNILTNPNTDSVFPIFCFIFIIILSVYIFIRIRNHNITNK